MLEKLGTEARNPDTMDLDMLSTLDVLKKMNAEDDKASKVIYENIEYIELAVQKVISSFNKGGRLIYIGAGNSGRLAVVDAAECVPTFNAPKEMVQGIIAGGLDAFLGATENAEDIATNGKKDLEAINITENDTIVGISASGRTPYVIAALTYANEVQATTVSVSCNKHAEMSEYADVCIELETGPEVLSGSTRLKAGSVQKMVLNMISTASMVGIGKVYKNLMVDVQPNNYKLEERSKQIIIDATEVDYETASKYFELADHHVKTAIIMILLHCTKEEAKEKIEAANGFVRKAIEQ